jgi:hypothetical protein
MMGPDRRMRSLVIFSGVRPQILHFGVNAEANQEDCSHSAENH